VRVGRAPLDEEAIRLLEQHNPDVEFDWTRILKDPPPVEAPRHDPREGRERRREPRPPRTVEPRGAAEHGEHAEHNNEEARASSSRGFRDDDRDRRAAAPEPPDAPSIAAVDSESPEAEPAPSPYSAAASADADPDRATDSPFSAADDGSAAYQRLGAEGLGRLRARFAEVMARIAEQPIDEDAREQLRARAERLNPDGWVTADEVAAALEQYESVFEELRAVVGREPRRRRRRR